MRFLTAYADTVQRVLAVIGALAGWLFVLNVVVICIDVVTRKIGLQIPGLGSTRLQELEWHFHMGLFILWLGLAYLRAGHVRIDVAVSRMRPRTLAWVELVGLLLLGIPYAAVLVYFGADFTWKSWLANEGSESATGLPWRWLAKSVLEFGLALLLIAMTAMVARLVVYLRTPGAADAVPPHLQRRG